MSVVATMPRQRPRATRWFALAVTLVIVASCAGSAEAAAPRFQGKAVGNSASGGRVAKKSFPIGAGYGLYFKDNRRSGTPYRLCAVFQGVTQRCVSGRTGRRGTDSIKSSPVIFNPQNTGTLDWQWRVNGRVVVTWRVTITPGD